MNSIIYPAKLPPASKRPTTPHIYLPFDFLNRSTTAMRMLTHVGDFIVPVKGNGLTTPVTSGMWMRKSGLASNLASSSPDVWNANVSAIPRWPVNNSATAALTDDPTFNTGNSVTLTSGLSDLFRMDNLLDVNGGGILMIVDFTSNIVGSIAAVLPGYGLQVGWVDGSGKGYGQLDFMATQCREANKWYWSRVGARTPSGANAIGSAANSSNFAVSSTAYQNARVRATCFLQRNSAATGTSYVYVNTNGLLTETVSMGARGTWPGPSVTPDMSTRFLCVNGPPDGNANNTDTMNRMVSGSGSGCEQRLMYFQRCEKKPIALLASVHAAFMANGQVPFDLLRTLA